MRMGVFRGEKCLRRRLTCRGLRVKLRHVYMSSSDSWMNMGLGKDVSVCSSQRSGIDAVHVLSMKSSMKFEFLALEVAYILVPTMAMDDWLRVSEVI